MPRAWVFPARSRPRGCEATGDSAPRTAGSPPQDPPTGGALGGRSRTGLSAPRRLLPRCASAGQAVDAPLRLKTARRPLKGEVSPCLGVAASPAVREAAGGEGHPGWSQTAPGRPPPPSAGRSVAPSASGGSAPPATRLTNCSRR